MKEEGKTLENCFQSRWWGEENRWESTAVITRLGQVNCERTFLCALLLLVAQTLQNKSEHNLLMWSEREWIQVKLDDSKFIAFLSLALFLCCSNAPFRRITLKVERVRERDKCMYSVHRIAIVHVYLALKLLIDQNTYILLLFWCMHWRPLCSNRIES